MASCKRAAMRREQKAERKLNSKEATPKILMERAFVAGKNEGMELALGIIFLALNEEFGFGKKRINRLAERISRESMKMDEDATKFNVQWYINQVKEKLDITLVKRGEV